MRRLCLAFVFVITFHAGWTQKHEEESIKNAQSAVFFGLDFSAFKLIHEDGFINKNGTPLCKSLTFKYFREWNEMFLAEPAKFSPSRYFSIPNCLVSLETSMALNQKYEVEGCIIEDDNYRIPADKFKSIVQPYSSIDSDLGVVIVMESMSKVNNECVFYPVFFDMKTHAIISSERVKGDPGGQGIRNYWVNAIHEGLSKTANRYR
jgi:hypothetical protein